MSLEKPFGSSAIHSATHLKGNVMSRRTHLHIDTLNERIAPAAGIINGVLVINGTAIIDYCTVWDTGAGDKAKVNVNLNGVVTSYLKSNFDNKIDFRGHDGDDVLASTSTTPTVARGGNGNDLLQTGSGNDNLDGEAGNDILKGNGGHDSCSGSAGNDNIDGGSGKDTLRGGSGSDVMNGGADADTLSDTDGNDTMYGGDGTDDLRGGNGIDQLFGGNGDDYLDGGSDADSINGDAGNDTLYGRDGNDSLLGGSGLDGLFAGLGDDTLDGGTDADRILTQDDNGDDWGMADFDYDLIQNVKPEDAVLMFVNDDVIWSEKEILEVDGAFARLHDKTNNTILLENPDAVDEPLQFHRAAVSEHDFAGMNNGDAIFMYNTAFGGGTNWLHCVVVHEFGHFWDSPGDNAMVEDFRNLSQWTTKYGSDEPGTALFVEDVWGDGGTWFYKAEHGDWWHEGGFNNFVSDYARFGPGEDFAETFSAVIMGTDFYDAEHAFAPVAKRFAIDVWLAGLTS